MSKKILFFTTSGPIDSQEKVIATTAAFSSWKKWGFDVVLFGEDYHKDLCEEYDFILNTDVEKEEGLPLIKSIFEQGLAYEGYDCYCYINTDIILLENIQRYIDAIQEDNFCAVGQRIDVWDLPPINFLTESYNDILKKIYPLKKELHQHVGIDYFCFTPGFWDPKDFPRFRIARSTFDNWLINHGITQGQGKMIDLSHTFQPLQLEPNSRPLIEGKRAEQINYNRQLGGYIKFGGTSNTPYFLTQEMNIEKR